MIHPSPSFSSVDAANRLAHPCLHHHTMCNVPHNPKQDNSTPKSAPLPPHLRRQPNRRPRRGPPYKTIIRGLLSSLSRSRSSLESLQTIVGDSLSSLSRSRHTGNLLLSIVRLSRPIEDSLLWVVRGLFPSFRPPRFGKRRPLLTVHRSLCFAHAAIRMVRSRSCHGSGPTRSGTWALVTASRSSRQLLPCLRLLVLRVVRSFVVKNNVVRLAFTPAPML